VLSGARAAKMQSHQTMILSEYSEPAFVHQALRLPTFSSTPTLVKRTATGPPRRAHGVAQFQRNFARASLKSADDGSSARKVISDRDAGTVTGSTPWQLAPAPVYAICTTSSEIGRPNMNILTYTTPCGLGPSPRFAVALLVGTLTWVSVKQTGNARLMLLAEGHAELVPLLGQLSGRDVDKSSVPARLARLHGRRRGRVDRLRGPRTGHLLNRRLQTSGPQSKTAHDRVFAQCEYFVAVERGGGLEVEPEDWYAVTRICFPRRFTLCRQGFKNKLER
jgi:hypothetical protein